MWVEERAMQQAWVDKLFDTVEFQTAEGEKLRVLHPGDWNHDQGPDFVHAQVEVDGVVMSGAVELHLDSKDWYRHGHHLDRMYNGVVLHVVMDESPRRAFRTDGTMVPTITLRGRIHEKLVERAQEKASKDNLACSAFVKADLNSARSELMRLYGLRRAQEKVGRTLHALKTADMDWEEACWRELMATVAGRANAEAFREVAQRVPFRLVRRYAHHPSTVGVLLRGAAGVLEKRGRMADEWKYLATKHGLEQAQVPLKKSRMRPQSFPLARMAQIVSLVRCFPVLTELFGEKGWARLRASEVVTYQLDSRQGKGKRTVPLESGRMGMDLKVRLAVNVLLPFGAAFQAAHGLGNAPDTLAAWLGRVPAEANKVVRKFQRAGFQPKSAFETQGLLSLERSSCSAMNCDSCPLWREIARLTLRSNGVDEGASTEIKQSSGDSL